MLISKNCLCKKPANSLLTISRFKTKTGAKLIVGLVLVSACLPSLSVAQATNDAKPDSQQQLQKLEGTLGTLAQKVDAQQQQIEDLKAALKRSAEELQQTKDQLKSSAAVTKPAVETTVLKSTDAKDVALQETRPDTSESPLALHYKNLSLIPGGFLAGETVFRTRNENSDMGSNFGGIPFDGTANANLSEFHASARASRLSMMLQTKYHNVDLTGFYEIDWYGVTPANDIKSNSYSPRQRQLWIRSDFQNGWSLTAGQMWSLLVRNKFGMAAGQEDSAPGDLIEGSFIVGHVWERQTGFRVVKGFKNKAWVGFAVENPQTTYSASNLPINMFGLSSSPNATSPSSDIIPYAAGVASGLSTDRAPDLIAKAAFEPGWGHYEIKAIYRFFRTRENGVTYDAYGTGLGVSASLPITRKLDFIAEGLAGEGIGRYSSGGGPDITIHPDGSPVPIRQLHASLGLEYHPSRKLSLFTYAGNEYYQRAAYVNSNGLGVGYGSPLIYNGNCQLEVPIPGLPDCTAQNRDIQQAIGGFWYRFYKGPYGTLQYGMNYERLRRNTWYAVAGQPQGTEDVVMTSVRFVLP
jgi:hypothetical protein